jgi:hypothetical protein
LIECSLSIEQQQKMMTRSKTAANAAKNEKAIVNEPKEAEAVAVEAAVASNMDDKTVVYPSMFDRWKEPL